MTGPVVGQILHSKNRGRNSVTVSYTREDGTPGYCDFEGSDMANLWKAVVSSD